MGVRLCRHPSQGVARHLKAQTRHLRPENLLKPMRLNLTTHGWATILKNTGVTIHQQRDFLRWLQKHFNMGTSKECKRAEKTGTGTWFKSPIGGKTTRSPWSIPKGTKFPIPSRPILAYNPTSSGCSRAPSHVK